MRRFISMADASGWGRWTASALMCVAVLLANAGPGGAADAPKPPEPDIAPDFKKWLVSDAAEVRFRADYLCKDETAGAGCSAGCDSASLSPIVRLTIILFSFRGRPPGANGDILYYLAQLPQPASRKAAAKAVMRAEGFIVHPTSLCGTVNMTMKVYDKWPKKDE
jgi:hypothetical protein